MIKWTFFFDEGNFACEVMDNEEDQRIETFCRECPKGILFLPNEKTNLWVNLGMVKCVARQILTAQEAADQQAMRECIKEANDEPDVSQK
jgi:hypothetical protein